MPFIVNTELGQQIKLEDKPFQTGGEGELYKIITPHNLTNHCVKLYYQQYQNDQRESKLKYMVNHKPQTLTDGSNFNICWATDVVYRQNKFAGFVMPLAFIGGIQLYELCTIKVRKNVDAIWHQKFDRSKSDTLPNRLKLCVNIAIAIHNIHSTKNYVLVDMKPQNVLVTPEGKVSIVDLDSIQIAENGNVIHQVHVATPEYVPAEGNKLNPSVNFIPETWDRFSLAIIFYELIFGLHPFVATSTGIYENITTIDESIKSGLFVFGSKSQYLQLPSLHNNFNLLPQKMKDCFTNALDKGHSNPNARPTAKEWGEVIFSELNPTITAVSSISSQPQVVYLDKTVYVEKPVERVVYKNNSWHLPFAIIGGVTALILFIFSNDTQRKLNSVQSEKNELTNQYQSLKTKNEKLSNLISKIADDKPFIIESIDFENSANRGNYKNTFTSSEIRYIACRINIIPLQNIGQAKIFVKYFRTYGELIRNPSDSPEGYSFSFEESISENTSELNSGGWGHDEGNAYEVGKHKVEIWYNDKLMGTGEFYVTN